MEKITTVWSSKMQTREKNNKSRHEILPLIFANEIICYFGSAYCEHTDKLWNMNANNVFKSGLIAISKTMHHSDQSYLFGSTRLLYPRLWLYFSNANSWRITATDTPVSGQQWGQMLNTGNMRCTSTTSFPGPNHKALKSPGFFISFCRYCDAFSDLLPSAVMV